MTPRSAFATLSFVLLVPLALAAQALPERVRVPERQDYTNVHGGPSTVPPPIVLAPAGTVFPVVKKQGEWYLVTLAPELRKLGMPMRWYKNETQGWVHESTVEVFVAPKLRRRESRRRNLDVPRGYLNRNSSRWVVPSRSASSATRHPVHDFSVFQSNV
jgi:hypothetical protein